ncbi:MAG: DUF349 domain-containing protein, partial [Bacteroidota bacterium]|nr:DUF349 domain-containing protein [Bacteroidota bacterium]
FLNFPERKIGEVKESEESTIRYFEERFLAAEEKVKEIEKAIIQSENKGSYLMKLIHLKQSLITHEGLGDYAPLFEKLDRCEKELYVLISQNREKNLEIKKALLDEAKLIKDTHDFKTGTEKFKEISEKWIKTGHVDKEQEEIIENNFKKIKEDFFSRRKSYYDDIKLLLQARLQQYKAIIEAVKESAAEEDLAKTVKKIKILQEKWKEIGEIPSRINKQLWARLKNHTDPVFEKYKTLKHSSNSNKHNPVNSSDHKKQLIQQVEALCINPAIQDHEKLKKIQDDWKKINTKSKDKKDPLKDEFFLVCDKARELFFIHKIAIAKNKCFSQKPLKDQIKIKMYLVKDLLNRDEKELAFLKKIVKSFLPIQMLLMNYYIINF